MRPKILMRLSPLFILLLLSVTIANPAQAEEAQPIIQGMVTNSLTGDPIQNATVIIVDLIAYTKETLTTDPQGRYSSNLTLNHRYRLYAYHDSPDTPGIDTVPVESIDIKVSEQVNHLDFALYPGASIILQNQVYYLGNTTARYTIYIIDPITGEPPILNNTVANFSNIFTWGALREAKDLGFNQSVAVIPAGILVDLKIKTLAMVKDPRDPLQPSHIEHIWFPVDNNTFHYTLPQGELVTADLGWYSLLMSTRLVNAFYVLTWEKLVDMERAGFYMGRVKEDMEDARMYIEEAQNLRAQGKYEESLLALATAYTTVTVIVVVYMEQMWLTAQSSAVVMPLFPAFFAVTMALFLFEALKKKILSACLLYGVFFAVLYYVYPGFQIVDVKFLLALASSSLILALFIAFGVPRLVKEPDIPGPYPFRAVLSVVFSMAKRNVRRRFSRGVLAIASLTILILAFTAFTSFGRALAILKSPLDIQPRYEGILIKNMPPPWAVSNEPYRPMYTEDVEGFRERHEVTLVSPIVWSPPYTTTLGLLRGQNQELTISGILGVDPSSEASLTHIDEYVTGSLIDLENVSDGVILSKEATSKLGAHNRDVLSFYLQTTGGLQFCMNLTLVGVIDDNGLSGLTDLDGKPLLPFKRAEGDYATSSAKEVLILNWRKALQIPGATISRIALQIGDQENPDSFARSVVLEKEYNVWASVNGKVTWWRFGTYTEIGGLTLLFPLIIVLLNIGLVMMSIVSERQREIFTFTCIGFNPTHIAALFLAESIVMGVIGGGLGYLLGMSSYRLMTLLSVDIAVRQKLEWYWSVIGVLLSVGVAVLSAVRPATKAAMRVAPSLVKKIKLPTERERVEREEEIYRVFQAQKVTMPFRIPTREALFFFSYFSDRMQGLKAGFFERIEDYTENEEETPKGELIKGFNFTYIYEEQATINELRATKKPEEEYYSLMLLIKPKSAGLPETFFDRTIRFVRQILVDWNEEKTRLMGAK